MLKEMSQTMLALRLPRNATEWMILGGVVAVSLVLYILVEWGHRKRRKKLASGVEALGLEIVEPGSDVAGYAHRQEKGQRDFSLELCGVGILWQRPARVAEYTFDTGRGKSSREWHNLQVSLGCAPDWPDLWVRPGPGRLRRSIMHAVGGGDVETGDPKFDKRWEVECSDPQGLEWMLSPEVRAILMGGPKQESWMVGDGWITLTWRKACGVADLRKMVERLAAVEAAMTGVA